MENEVVLAPAGPDLSSTRNLGPGSGPLYPGAPNKPGLFGSNRTEVAPVPLADPLDNELTLKDKRLQSLHKALALPLNNFLQDDKTLKDWRDEASQINLEIQNIQEKKQQQQTMQMTARNRGLTRTL